MIIMKNQKIIKLNNTIADIYDTIIIDIVEKYKTELQKILEIESNDNKVLYCALKDSLIFNIAFDPISMDSVSRVVVTNNFIRVAGRNKCGKFDVSDFPEDFSKYNKESDLWVIIKYSTMEALATMIQNKKEDSYRKMIRYATICGCCESLGNTIGELNTKLY